MFLLILQTLSCATLPSDAIPESLIKNENSGMIIGSIAFKNKKPIFNSYIFYYNEDNKTEISEAKMLKINPEQIISMKFNPDFFDGEKAVYYFSVTEMPGKFNFVKLRLFENGGLYAYSKEYLIDIDFIIEKGKVKYLGEIYFDYHQQTIQLTGQSERDIPKLNQKFPKLLIEN